jgi:drug/metabolite transporter (DMT)-like permease
MPSDIFVAVLIAALLHAGWNVAIKSGADKFADTVAVSAGAGLLALVSLPFVAMPGAASLPWLVASIAVHVLYFGLVAAIYRAGDLSIAYPLMRGLPPLLSAAAITVFTGERLSATGWLAVAILCAGVIALGAQSLRPGSSSRLNLPLLLLNVCVIGAYTVIDGIGVRLSASAAGYVAWMFAGLAVAMVAGGFALRGIPILVQVALRGRFALAGGLATIGAYGIVLWAMTRAPIGLVAALRETSVVFGAGLAALLLKERFGAWRWAAVAMVAAGAALSRLAG